MARSSTFALLAGAVTALALLAPAPPAQALLRPLDPADGGTGDHLGWSVAMDGDTLVAGAPGQGSARGAVYVFTRTAGETWAQTAKLTASDGVDGDGLGTSVAVDGDTIVAGAPGHDDDTGAVYLFSRTGSADRTQTGTLTAGDGADGDAFGSSVDIDDGTVVVGAPGDDLPGLDYDPEHGSVYTFSTTGGPSAKLTASDNTTLGYYLGGSMLGSSVAIDGDTIVAGAPLDNYGAPTGNRRGSVYTFSATGAAARTETAKLSVSGVTYGRLGVAVDVRGDLVVAGDEEANDAFGLVYTFTRTGAAARTQTGTLAPANPRQNSGFGRSLSLSDDFVAVGAPSYSAGGSASAVGAGYLFTRTGPAGRAETWFTSGGGTNGEAYATSIVTDGDRVVAGAPYVDASDPSFLQDRGRVFSSTPDLYVSTVGSGTGSVARSAEEPHLLGDQVTLTATAAGGSHFAGWENVAGCPGTGPCVVTMTGSRQIAARFEPGAGDTTPPTVAIDSGPASGSTVTSGSVAFGFSADETSTFACAYDGAAFVPCTSPGPGLTGTDARTGLAEGAHTFAVRATDPAGNASTTQSRTFTVDLPSPPPPPPGDTTRPQTRITQAPPRTVRAPGPARVKVAFAASEPARFVCRVDGRAEKACTSPATFRLGVGRHTITVVAIDRAGNRDASPAKVTITVKRRKR